jgi:hypothetical protein
MVLSFENTFSQNVTPPVDVDPVAKALDGFHEIIHPIWHKAYPAKDIEALKGFVPQIKTAMEAVNKVTLPEALKSKEADWKKQLSVFNKAAEAYYAAAKGESNEAMLKAASDLHLQYEITQSVIR